MPDDFPWPDAETLAAGDEDLLVEPWPQERPFQENGELATLDYWRRHPDEP